MELASKMRWVIVVFVVLIVIVFLGWGLSAIARSIFSAGSDSTQVEETAGPSIDGAASVRYIVDGPIVASKDHRRYEIDISERVVMMRLLSDYGQKVITEKSYQNNAEAYDTFIEALSQARATARVSGTTTEDDYNEQGVCPTGQRYILEVGDIIRRWTASCDRKLGTAGGKMTTMRNLFIKQVPDFNDIVKDTTLNRQ